MTRYLECCKEKRVHPQDGLRSWLVCASAALSNLLFTGFGLSYGIMIPVLMREFKTNREKTAWAGSTAAALVCLLSPISCSLSERFGCRIVAICGSLICMISLLSSSFVTKLELLYFTHGIMFGLGNNFIHAPPFLVISESFTKWRSFALSLANAGTATGMLIYSPCLQLMLDSFGWRHTLRVISSISIFGSVLACSYSSKLVQKSSVEEEYAISKRNGQGESGKIMKDKNERESMRDKENQNGYNHKGKCRETIRAYCSVWRTPMYTVFTVSSTLACVAELLPMFNLVKHGQELGFLADSVADLYIYLGLASIIGRIVAGILLGLTKIKSQHLYQISLFANGTVTLFLPIISGYYGLVGYVLVYGACDGIFWAVLNVSVINSVEANMRGAALGMLQFLNSISMLLGPPFAGWIADIHISYKPTFYMSGTISILAGLMVFLLHCGRRKIQKTVKNLNVLTQKNRRMENGDMKITLSDEWDHLHHEQWDTRLSFLHYSEENKKNQQKTKLCNDTERLTSSLIEIVDRETVL